jgi:hypothetical protein
MTGYMKVQVTATPDLYTVIGMFSNSNNNINTNVLIPGATTTLTITGLGQSTTEFTPLDLTNPSDNFLFQNNNMSIGTNNSKDATTEKYKFITLNATQFDGISIGTTAPPPSHYIDSVHNYPIGGSGSLTCGEFTLTWISYTGPYSQGAPSPCCFIEGTKLYSHIRNKYVYTEIENLRPGNIVKTHLHGDKQIKYIGKGSMTNNPSQWNGCVRRLPRADDMIDDLLVTGAHSILVDELSTKETEGMIAIYGTADRKIDDKTLLLSWVSDKFEAVEDTEEYTYYHLVLEHDDDDTKRYGIWANGVLTESQCEKHFLAKDYELL